MCRVYPNHVSMGIAHASYEHVCFYACRGVVGAGQGQLEALHEKARLAREAAQGSAVQLSSLEANMQRLEEVLAVRGSPHLPPVQTSFCGISMHFLYCPAEGTHHTNELSIAALLVAAGIRYAALAVRHTCVWGICCRRTTGGCRARRPGWPGCARSAWQRYRRWRSSGLRSASARRWRRARARAAATLRTSCAAWPSR